ncbi:hypothetical protein EVAR_39665_1 [Eumeta japonica]|uniref:Uncharacterized protein n=1 Tax=Eumeta variegata TaxID=151549 RepID=A0A4C1Z307_EUMVA|nr:hypothetical protein EVAR_39665_1 [Eumeta japonica]
MGKEGKNPLWAVHAPGHTGVSDSHRLKNLRNNLYCSGESLKLESYKAMTPTSVRGHFGMEMPSARDCPMGVFTRHLGIGSHVKLQCGLQLPKSDTGRRWERTGLVTFQGRDGWAIPTPIP